MNFSNSGLPPSLTGNPLIGRGMRLLVLVLVCLSATACSLSPWRAEQVEQRVVEARQQMLTCSAEEKDRCSEFSPIMALAADNHRLGRHHLLLLETGEDALKIRIHLIRAAQEHIEFRQYRSVGCSGGSVVRLHSA